MSEAKSSRWSRLTGRAGEYAVASQLLLRDVLVYWPSVDLGCDLETENHCRIQIKCAHLSNGDDRESPAYQFPLRKQEPRAVSDIKITVFDRKPFMEVCDFVIFWGIDQNRFWIVPAHLCDACTGVRLGSDLVYRPRLVADMADVREMISLGYSQAQIARHYGVTHSIIQRFLRGGKDWDESTVSQMRACENAWDKIVNFRMLPVGNTQEPQAKENSSENL